MNSDFQQHNFCKLQTDYYQSVILNECLKWKKNYSAHDHYRLH